MNCGVQIQQLKLIIVKVKKEIQFLKEKFMPQVFSGSGFKVNFQGI